MPDLRLVTGTLRAIEQEFVRTVALAREGDPLAPVTVLVGQTLLKRYLPRMLAQRGSGHINVRFVLPDELAAELGPRLDAGRTTPAQERFLVRLASSNPGPFFARISRGEAFESELTRLFRDLERGGFSPESFKETLGAARMASEKLDELAAMFAAFAERRTAAGLGGPGAAYVHPGKKLSGPLLVYGLWAPSALHLQLIGRIARSNNCTAFLVSSGLGVDVAHEAFRNWLEAHEFGPEQLPPEQAQGIDTAADALFRNTTGRGISSEGIELCSAPDTVREVWEAARTCLQWGRDGIGFHEMAVVYRNASPYHAMVAEVFREAGLSDHTYIHQGRPMGKHPLGRRLLLLLDLIEDETFSRQRVMEFVTETRVGQAVRERFARLRPAEWDRFTREAGVIAGIEQWRARLRRLAEELRSSGVEERHRWRNDQADHVETLLVFVEDLFGQLSRRPATASWQDHLDYVRALATDYAEGLDPLLEALEDLKVLTPIQAEVPFHQFADAVRDDLVSRDVSEVLGEPRREFGKRGIAVLDASSLRHMRFRAVYLLGVSERAWPPPKRPDPLLLEHERKAINEVATSERSLPLRTFPDDEGLTFHLAVQAARERLVVSYARADASGGGRHLPSYFFRALAQALEGREMGVDDVEASGCVRRLPAGRLAHEDAAASVTDAEYDRALVGAAVVGKRPGVINALATFDSKNPLRPGGAIERAVEARRRRWSPAVTEYDGAMSMAGMARMATTGFARERAVSPSRMETYAECPYRYFLRYELHAEPSEEPEVTERIDALERGTLIHEVLERFLAKIGRADPPSQERRPQHITWLLDIAKESCDDRQARGVTGRPLIWELDRRRLNEDLVRWYDEEIADPEYARVQPGAFEMSFGLEETGGPPSSSAPLDLEVSDRKLLLHGRVDRVDFNEARTAFRVIDYKTGSARNKAAFDKGMALQLPVYLLAASELLGIPFEEGEAQYYYCTSRGGFKRRTITGRELAERWTDFEQVLLTIAEGAEAGMFVANPGRSAYNCTYCDYRLVCDSRIEQITGRKKSDPRLSGFIAMQEIK